MEHPDFDPNKITAFYAHGFSESLNSLTIRTLLPSFRARASTYNVLLLDWAKPAYPNGNYTIAVYNSFVVSVSRIVDE